MSAADHSAFTSNVTPLFPDAVRAQARPDLNAELVSSVLMLLEDAASYSDIFVERQGRAIRLFIGERLINLTPEQARMTGHALFHDPSFAGCIEIAARLIEASVGLDEIVTIMPTRRPHSGRTGFASTFGLVIMLVSAYALAGFGSVAHGLG